MIIRWSPIIVSRVELPDDSEPDMQMMDNGEYVTYEDHQSQLTELREEIETLKISEQAEISAMNKACQELTTAKNTIAEQTKEVTELNDQVELLNGQMSESLMGEADKAREIDRLNAYIKANPYYTCKGGVDNVALVDPLAAKDATIADLVDRLKHQVDVCRHGSGRRCTIDGCNEFQCSMLNAIAKAQKEVK